ncbi:hypothetical protein ULMA_20700 [Patiriisocius marinus]|uniref:Uncharacterized protein n=1 Tax=Patiriisocius marinus TaxID=1397112 RepID=A0A5J4IZK9_9FLAO|nr:hypothetical protein [Patiriisocius marinus]GER59962.1 hypothetical protein ULMA_20700 [Patiriisocius marinus]
MKTIKISAGIALTFFVIGSLLFLLQLVLTDRSTVPVIGFYYVFTAVIINSIVVLTLIGKLFIDQNYTETLKSIAIILANVPVAIAYTYIVFEYTF